MKDFNDSEVHAVGIEQHRYFVINLLTDYENKYPHVKVIQL